MANGAMRQIEEYLRAVKPSGDPVSQPAHYRVFADLMNRNSIETIDVVELVAKHYPSDIAGHVMQLLQYLIRAPHKNDLLEDMRKAEQYLRRAINVHTGKPSWDLPVRLDDKPELPCDCEPDWLT